MALYQPAATFTALAAALPWALLRNHPFADGNKRIAFAALAIFAERNGFRLTCTEVEETAMVLQAEGGEMGEVEWVRRVDSVVTRK